MEHPKGKNNFAELRKKAETPLETEEGVAGTIPMDEARRLIDELHTYQIELELQNEELRKAQIDLLNSQKKFTDLYDFAPVGYLTLSHKGLITGANLTIAEMLGVERRFLYKCPLPKFISPEDQDLYYQCWQELVRSRTAQTCELRMVKKDGGWFHACLRCNFHLHVDGNSNQFLIVITDSTERRQAEEILWSEMKFTESLIKTAQAIIIVLDPEGRIIRFNPYLEKISGYKFNEVQGKDWFETFLPNQGWQRIREIFKKAIGDINTKGNVTPITTRDGREIYIEWYDKTLQDSTGEIVGLLAIGQDITERRQAEEEKEILIESLQAANAEIKTLRGIVPICSYCKQIRDDQGFWSQVEEYVGSRTEAAFSHGICPDCIIKYYPDLVDHKEK